MDPQGIIVLTVMTSFPLRAGPLQDTGFVLPAQQDRVPETEIGRQPRLRTDRWQPRRSNLSELMPSDLLGRKTKPGLRPSSGGMRPVRTFAQTTDGMGG